MIDTLQMQKLTHLGCDISPESKTQNVKQTIIKINFDIPNLLDSIERHRCMLPVQLGVFPAETCR